MTGDAAAPSARRPGRRGCRPARAAEPGLDRQRSMSVRRVAAGRAKRRRLAQALLDRPSLLTDGRSPAPRVAGDLLIALRQAGAVIISPPVCAGCGKQLRTCSAAARTGTAGSAAPARAMRRLRAQQPVSVRDRQGRPRCGRCPDRRDPDPVEDRRRGGHRGVDPSLPAGTVAPRPRRAAPGRPAAAAGVGAPGRPRAAHRRRRAGASPVGAAADRRARRRRGAADRPPRLPALRAGHRPGQAATTGCGCCRNCVARSRAVPCSRCGAVREPATRDEHGRPLCPYCLISDPANLETCVGCGRRRASASAPPAARSARPAGRRRR